MCSQYFVGISLTCTGEPIPYGVVAAPTREGARRVLTDSVLGVAVVRFVLTLVNIWKHQFGDTVFPAQSESA